MPPSTSSPTTPSSQTPPPIESIIPSNIYIQTWDATLNTLTTRLNAILVEDLHSPRPAGADIRNYRSEIEAEYDYYMQFLANDDPCDKSFERAQIYSLRRAFFEVAAHHAKFSIWTAKKVSMDDEIIDENLKLAIVKDLEGVSQELKETMCSIMELDLTGHV